MSLSIEADPIQIAKELQNTLIDTPTFDKHIEIAKSALTILAPFATTLIDNEARFLIDCSQAFDRPNNFNNTNKITLFGNLALEGVFNDFTYLSIGKIDKNPINALCLSLKDFILLPNSPSKDPITSIQTNEIMHIPVLAIDRSLQIS